MTLQASIEIDPAAVIAPVNPRTFGSFVEHMGRCVYTGISEPGHVTADDDGLRGDVLDLVREMGVTVVRYPGGNFVSGYRWEDGVGPVQDRPVRLDPAWKTVEPNTFGLDEFSRWAEKAEVEIMLALNLGTRGVQEALDLIEYCNHPSGTFFSDLRRSHGREIPYSIRSWCLGNEMDGPWQLGHKTADEYGRLAAETARAMRMIDPDIELVVCGSSGPSMPTFGDWEERVLEHTYEQVDLISAHSYYEPDASDLESFMASAVDMDRFIRTVASIADRVGARKKSRKRIDISFDEWNVWYMRRMSPTPEWDRAPRLAEDLYDVADAVVVGSLLMTLLRNNDRVAVACQAQLVNAISAIRTEPGGPAWRQSIFHPFALTARHAKGEVLSAQPIGPRYDCARYGEVPMVDSVATHDPSTGELSVFSVNRSTEESVQLEIDLRAFPGYQLAGHLMLDDEDHRATNSEHQQNRVEPREAEVQLGVGRADVLLSPVSWSLLRLVHSPRDP
ncbi:MAG TPA: alpha-N-arabinofuranosidase [Acidimicrobiia bacterium]|nr:alpha-N-arabinofuranosidase [Acidimicrobiia bacterium]